VAACFAGCAGGKAMDVIGVHARLHDPSDGLAITDPARRRGL
jgi:hypothetical protein